MDQTAYRAQASQYRLWCRQNPPMGHGCKPTAYPLPRVPRCDPPPGYQPAWAATHGNLAFQAVRLSRVTRGESIRRLHMDNLIRGEQRAWLLSEGGYTEQTLPSHYKQPPHDTAHLFAAHRRAARGAWST